MTKNGKEARKKSEMVTEKHEREPMPTDGGRN